MASPDQEQEPEVSIDTEVNALAACYRELVTLDKEAQGRALRYLAQRLGVSLFGTTPAPSGIGGGSITITPCNGPVQYDPNSTAPAVKMPPVRSGGIYVRD